MTMRTAPARGQGVVAVDFRGDRYCPDCAKHVLDGESFSYETSSGEWESVEDADGEGIAERLISGDIHTLSTGGVVLSSQSSHRDRWHCGRGRKCVHALDGDEHDYSHDETVGVLLDI